MARIIAIANQKGGVGKTTTTANLGAALASLNRRVLLVDFDPQSNLTAALGCSPAEGQTLASALLSLRAPLPVMPITGQQGVQLQLVPSTPTLAATEAALAMRIGGELRLRDKLATVTHRYTDVLIDTPPSLGLLTINALVAAQGVIVPTEARYFSLQGLQVVQTCIKEVHYLNPQLRLLGVLLSKYDRRLKEERAVAAFVRQEWGAAAFQTEIRADSKILEAASAGVSVFAYAGADAAAQAYCKLAREVVART